MNKLNLIVYLADQNPHRDRSLGITSFTDCLLRELAKRDEIAVTTISSRSSYSPDAGPIAQICLPWRTNQPIQRLVTDHLHPLFIRSHKADIFYYPKGWLPLALRTKASIVVTIHDTIVDYYRRHYGNRRLRISFYYWMKMLSLSIQRADLITTVSENAKKQILEFCAQQNIACPNVTVCYQSSPLETFAPPGSFAKDNFVLHLASAEPHKRTLHLLRWWRILQDQQRDIPPLVLVGHLCPEAQRLVAQVRHVSHKPRLPRLELIALMQKARALIFPSEIEGFGIPALEAYYVGTPVCYVGQTAVHEILLPATDKGKFVLDDLASFEIALAEILSLSDEDILGVRNKLRNIYSTSRFGDRIMAGFMSCRKA